MPKNKEVSYIKRYKYSNTINNTINARKFARLVLESANSEGGGARARKLGRVGQEARKARGEGEF